MKKMIGQPQMIKEVNKDIIEDIIAEKGPISKPEIAKITSLSLPTVNKVVDYLVENDRIKISGAFSAGIGRKAQLYVVNENSGNILALLFIDDFFICTVANAVGDIVYKQTMPVDTTDKNTALESTYRAIDHLISHSSNSAKAIGIGVPGIVNSDNTLSDIPSISGWEGMNLKEVIEQKYKISTFVENDVKLSTMGFYYNELKQQHSDVLYIFIGKGLGSGIIINKKLYKGFRSFSGELGYMVTEKPSETEKQTLKTKGQLERKVGALLKDIRIADSEQAKNAETHKLIELLSFSLLNLICVLNPEVIVFSGEIINERFVEELKDEVLSLIDDNKSPQLMIDNSKMSGIYGIVSLCLSSISYKYQLVRGSGV